MGIEPGKVNYVPFKGGGEAVSAIIGGHVTAGVSGLSEFSQHIKSGKMRALAVSAPKAMEGIPSLKEQGINVELSNWRGIFGAPGITKAQRDELVKTIEKGVKSKEWQEALKRQEWDDFYLAGDAYAQYITAENKRVGDILGSLSLGKK
jgi:putative tricarboxylic transport membrane protein